MNTSIYVTKFVLVKDRNSTLFMRAGNTRLSKINCIIQINPKEGYIPHFHIVAENHSFESCICIAEATYFNHSANHIFLNQGELNQLDAFMRQINEKEREFTNWQQTANLWNVANPDNRYDIVDASGRFIPQPDYTKTSGNKFINYGKGQNKKK